MTLSKVLAEAIAVYPESTDDSVIAIQPDPPIRPPHGQAAPRGKSILTYTLADAARMVLAFFSKKSMMFHFGICVFTIGAVLMIQHGAAGMDVTTPIGFILIMGAGASLLGMGWFLLRYARPWALLLQGTAICVLFGCLYAGGVFHGMFPLSVAFAALFVLSVLAGFLAVIQNAREIAVMSLGIGFIAPLLCPVGNGETGYVLATYLVLTLGILGISWFRAWRELNPLGLLFTLTFGITWGHGGYTAADLPVVEAFLVAMFIIHLCIAIRHAATSTSTRDTRNSLFMAALAAAAFVYFQTGLLHRNAGMMAITLGLLSLLCSSLAWGLRRRFGERTKLLILLFFTLALIFGNLSVPLAFTLVRGMSFMILLWACEALILVRIGLGFRKPLVLGIGLGLQVLTAWLLAGMSGYYTTDWLTAAAGMAAIISAFVSAFWIDTRMTFWLRSKNVISGALILWSLLVWVVWGYLVMILNLPAGYADTAVLGILTVTAWGLYAVYTRLGCEMAGRVLDLFYGPSLMLFAVIAALPDPYLSRVSQLPFSPSPFAWPVAVLSWYYLIYLRERRGGSAVPLVFHRIALWCFCGGLAFGIYAAVASATPPGSAWAAACAGSALAILVWSLIGKGDAVSWPVAAHIREYQGVGLLPVLAAVWIILLNGCLSDGNAAPLCFFPLVNPLEISQILCFLALFEWKRKWIDSGKEDSLPPMIRRHVQSALYGSLFLCLTSAVGRAVTCFVIVDFAPRIFFSAAFQTSLSVIWSLLAAGVLYLGRNRQDQSTWRRGSLILFLVVVKLFMVDSFLSHGMGRAFGFMWVGLIMTLSGHLGPLGTTASLAQEGPKHETC